MTSNPNDNRTLKSLEDRAEFIGRHIGPRDADLRAMLERLGLASLEELIDQATPAGIRTDQPLDLATARNEAQVLDRLRRMADANTVNHSLIGLGYHPTHVPPVILRNVLENPGWYTAYTPYQAEISQGRLEGLLNFQQMVMDLTGMELAGASLLDEATAAAEGMAMARRIARRNRSARFIVDADCLPQTIDVVANRARHLDIDIVVAADPAAALAEGDCFGVLLQYPGASGRLSDPSALIEQAHAADALAIVATDLLGLALIRPPGEMDADIVVGSAQRFGVPMGYGGPHAAFLATHEKHRRSVPGRIIGVSRDRHGNPALRMALQTREQHIRREKAMSNICTAQALLAVMAGFYGVWHGAEGIRTIAERVHRLARVAARALADAGLAPVHETFFDTLLLAVDEEHKMQILQQAQRAGYNLRADLDGHVGITFNEVTTAEQVAELVKAITGKPVDLATVDAKLDGHGDPAISPALRRRSAYLTHEVFSRYHSETEMLRYLKRLENRDLSLTHAMIPLGSCTMKLNATAEMIPVTWPEFAELHPLCPHDQARGYHQLIADLEGMLREITGFSAISLQPNAGSQGEYAGLLTIRRWQEARGQGHRDVCLIPSSAHGTNPASAQMVGYRIVVVGCDSQGNIDRADLDEKIGRHRDALAALMITYPSTHGVFESEVIEICEAVRAAGGQVYLDGANMNALVGVSRVADYADVCHLNLHKTFCIPHGGGGPGVGPIGVREHLAAHLPGHVSGILGAGSGGNPAVAAAPWGSAAILPISWAYIALMGRDGLRKATEVAILNANYVAEGLKDHYDILYTGKNGRIAHECIVDLRPFKETAGITEEDVAKRLIDYGFHAPTMSWPVPGTLMIEPTESESRQELDRFIEAMIEIRREIDRVAAGQFDAEDNPLKMAPHTIAELSADDWPHAYSRQQAGWPLAALKFGKFFAPVGRVDNVYGDRNLVCSCPPLEDWLEAS